MIGSRSHTYSTAEHDRRIALGLAEPTGRPTASACSTCGARLWDRPETTNGSCAACTTSAEKHDAVEAARADERTKLAKWARDEASRQQSAAAAATKAKDPREADRCDGAVKALEAVAKRMGAK